MKIGDLVKLRFSGNGRPNTGIIYERAPARHYNDEVEFKCLWAGDSMWNDSLWREHELTVINESR